MPLILDRKSTRESLSLENKFIINLCKFMPVRHAPVDESQYLLDNDKTEPGFVSASEKRGTSLEELHKKLQELKGKKLRYRGTLFKKGVKNKIDKIKKREAKKSKRTLLKVNKAPTNLVSDVKHKPIESTAPVFNKEGHLVFNKFDFSENLSGNSKKNRNKKENDPQKILKHLNEQEEKINLLQKVGNTEKAKALKEKIAWKTALQRAQGNKVKDDPKLLVKTLKRKDAAKKRSKKQWEIRENLVEQKMQKKQEIRQANIKKKVEARKAKKIKRLVKKGRLIPGIHV